MYPRTINPVKIWLDLATMISKQSPCKLKKVGAVIVTRTGAMLSGFNIPTDETSNCCSNGVGCGEALDIVHAEMSAICKAAKNGISLEDSTLFCTHSPCMRCAKHIVECGITSIYFLEEHKNGVSGKYLKQKGIKMYQVKHINREVDKRVEMYDELREEPEKSDD